MEMSAQMKLPPLPTISSVVGTVETSIICEKATLLVSEVVWKVWYTDVPGTSIPCLRRYNEIASGKFEPLTGEIVPWKET